MQVNKVKLITVSYIDAKLLPVAFYCDLLKYRQKRLSASAIIKILIELAKYLLKIPPYLICVATLPCDTLTSENERQSPTNVVINNKLQGTVVTYLRCGGIFNNQIKKGLLLSMSVKKFLKSMSISHRYGHKDCVVDFLRLLAVW